MNQIWFAEMSASSDHFTVLWKIAVQLGVSGRLASTHPLPQSCDFFIHLREVVKSSEEVLHMVKYALLYIHI